MKAIVPMCLTVPASATAFWFMTSRKQKQPNPDRRNRARNRWLLSLFLAAVATDLVATESRWWMDEPVRLIQTNLRETDSTQLRLTRSGVYDRFTLPNLGAYEVGGAGAAVNRP